MTPAFWGMVACIALIWGLDHYENQFYDDYVAKCDARGGRVVKMPVRGHKDWLQCVSGLDVIRILPDDAELPQ